MAYNKNRKHGTVGRLDRQQHIEYGFNKEVIQLKSTYTVTLSSVDIFQTIDALSSRAESYEQTAHYLMGNHEANEHIIIEECRDHLEAQAIANHFREIIKKIQYEIV